MSKFEQHDLEKNFGFARFIVKSIIVFSVIMAGVAQFKDVSPLVENGMHLLHSNPYALPVLFVRFLPLHLLFELVNIRNRKEYEESRSSPARQRRPRISTRR